MSKAKLSEMERLFEGMKKFGASDLHVKVGAPPLMRVSGSIRSLEVPALTTDQADRFIKSIMAQPHIDQFEAQGDVDFAYRLEDGQRFRVNVYLERGTIAGAALDTYDVEPLPPEHPFLRLPNLVLSPHLGYVIQENYRVYFTGVLESIQAFSKGAPVRVLNPEVLESPQLRGPQDPV